MVPGKGSYLFILDYSGTAQDFIDVHLFHSSNRLQGNKKRAIEK